MPAPQIYPRRYTTRNAINICNVPSNSTDSRHKGRNVCVPCTMQVLQKRMTGLTNIAKVGVCTTYGFTEKEVATAGDAGRLMISGGMTMLFKQPCQVTWKVGCLPV